MENYTLNARMVLCLLACCFIFTSISCTKNTVDESVYEQAGDDIDPKDDDIDRGDVTTSNKKSIVDDSELITVFRRD